MNGKLLPEVANHHKIFLFEAGVTNYLNLTLKINTGSCANGLKDLKRGIFRNLIFFFLKQAPHWVGAKQHGA